MKIRRIDLSADEFIAGIAAKMTLEELGAYWLICLLIYSRGGPIDDDPEWLSGLLRKTNPRTVRAVVSRLVEMGKVQRNDAELMVNRCRMELERASKRVRTWTENGMKGGRPSNKNNNIPEPKGFSPENPASNHQPPTKDSVPNGTDASASETEDLKTRIFGPAREWLGKQTGKPDRSIRSMLGKWCSQHGDGRTLEALQNAAKNAPLDPVPYIEKLLRMKPDVKRSYDEQRQSDLAAIYSIIAPELGTVDGCPGDGREPPVDYRNIEAVAGTGGPLHVRPSNGSAVRVRPLVRDQRAKRNVGIEDLPGDAGGSSAGSSDAGNHEDGGDVEVGEPFASPGGREGDGIGGTDTPEIGFDEGPDGPEEVVSEAIEERGTDWTAAGIPTGLAVGRQGSTADGTRSGMAAEREGGGNLVDALPTFLRRT